MGCALLGGKPEIRGSSSNGSSPGQINVAGNAINEETPPSPPSSLTSNSTNKTPAKNATPIVPAVPTPTYAVSRLLNAGESLEFSEGSVKLIDVWGGSGVLPAALAISGPRGENYTELQLVLGQAAKYRIYGRDFWVYADTTDAGATTSIRRALLHVLEAREIGGAFDKSLYSDVLPAQAATIAGSSALGRQVASGLLNSSQSLRANGGLTVKFEDARRYPSDGSVAMVKIWDDYSEPSYASIPLGQAYVYAPANTVKYMIYYGAGGIGSISGKPMAGLQVFEAGPLVEGKNHLVDIANYSSKPGEKRLVGKFGLKAGQDAAATRDFYMRYVYLRMIDCSGAGNGFATAWSEDQDRKPIEMGIIGQDYPMYFKDNFNLSYSVWLESLSCITNEASVSVYKE